MAGPSANKYTYNGVIIIGDTKIIQEHNVYTRGGGDGDIFSWNAVRALSVACV